MIDGSSPLRRGRKVAAGFDSHGAGGVQEITMGQFNAQQDITIDAGPQAQMMRTQTRGTQALAIMQPRAIKAVERAALEEAALLGDLAYYGWGAGKDRVEGPAWPLTKSLMRVYGNCSLDMDPVQDLTDGWVFTARAVDHETGFSISRQFRQSKRWTVHGKFDDARKDDIRFQIGQSKALRNVALAFLPEWLVERAMDVARGNVRGQIEQAIDKHGLDAVTAKAIERAGAIGCDEARLLAAMGRKARAALTIEDLVIISGGIKAVERGTDTLDDVFPLPAVEAGTAGARAGSILAAMGVVTGKPAPAPLVTDAEMAAAMSPKPKAASPEFVAGIEAVKAKMAEPEPQPEPEAAPSDVPRGTSAPAAAEQHPEDPPFSSEPIRRAPMPPVPYAPPEDATPAAKARARRGAERGSPTPPAPETGEKPASRASSPTPPPAASAKPKARFDVNGDPIEG